MSASGTVTIRFDVQGNEKLLQTLITSATGMEKLKGSATSLQSTLNGFGVGNLGPLNNIATSVNNAGNAMATTSTKVATFKEKLAGIGTQLGANATSFGVATASIWGVYNAYDSLEKVQIRAHASAVKVQTLETSLAALTERRRIAVEKGNLTSEQMAILNEKIANTQEKLSVAQERNADVTQDVSEAWAGFISTVGPQAIAATGSIIQLGLTFKGTFASGGGFINTFKNAIIGLSPQLSAMKTQSLLLRPALGGIGPAAEVAGVGVRGFGAAIRSVWAALGPVGLAIIGVSTAIGFLADWWITNQDKIKGDTEKTTGVVVDEFGNVISGTKDVSGAHKAMADTIVANDVIMRDKLGKPITFAGFLADPRGEANKPKPSPGATVGKPETAKSIEELTKGNSFFSSSQDEANKKIEEGTQRAANWHDELEKVLPPLGGVTTLAAEGMGMDATSGTLEDVDVALAATGANLNKFANTSKYTDTLVDDLSNGMTGAFQVLTQGGPVLSSTVQGFAGVSPTLAAMVQGFGGVVAAMTPAQQQALILNSLQKDQAESNARVNKTWDQYSKIVAASGGAISTQAQKETVLKGVMDSQVDSMGNKIELTDAEKDSLKGMITEQDKVNDARLTEVASLKTSVGAYVGLSAVQGKSVGQLQDFNETLGASIGGIEDQVVSVLKWADAEKLANESTQEFVNSQFDFLDSMVNVNKINDGGVASLIKLRQAHLDGLTAAQDFYTSLVTGGIKTETTTKAIADNAKIVGIQANMMAFSATKAQELITTTYNMNTAFSDQALAAATDVKWLNDKAIIDAQLKQGQIEGAQAANAWTVELIKSTESSKAQEAQLRKNVEAMTGFSDLSNLSNTELQTMATRFEQTKSGADAFGVVMSARLTPALETFSGLINATDMKAFNDEWKKMNFGSIPKGVRGDFKDMFKDLREMGDKAGGIATGIDAVMTAIITGSKEVKNSDIRKVFKEINDDLGDLAKVDKSAVGLDKLFEPVEKLKGKKLEDWIFKFGNSLNLLKERLADKWIDPKDKLDILVQFAQDANISGDAIQTLGEQMGLSQEEIDQWKIADAAKDAAKLGPSALSSVAGVNSLTGSITDAADALATFASAQLDVGKSSPLTNLWLSQQIPNMVGGGDGTTTIPTPEPVVFPPPNIDAIIEGVSKAQMIVDDLGPYVAGLTIAFPEPTTDNIITGISNAQQIADDLGPYIEGLPLAFSAPTTENIIAGVSEAQQIADDLGPYIAGLPLAFSKPNTSAVTAGATIANATIKTVQTFISGSAMKLTFQKPIITQIESAVSAATKSMKSLEGIASGLKLKFPKPNISEIEKGVNEAQSKINSLKGTTVTNHVKTVFDNAGGNILNDIKLMSAAAGKLFTTNGEQLFRVGDNPGGRETVAMIPHDKPGPIIEKLNQMFPNVYSTLHQRARKQATQSVSSMGGGNGGGQRSGPTTVNVTTEVYLFPGSDMFKKFIKSIMLEEMSRYVAV